MAETQTFRSAFNGFNRKDVVSYIELLNNRHTSERNQLNTQLQLLREALDRAQADAAREQAVAEALHASDAERQHLEQELAALREDYSALRETSAQQAQAAGLANQKSEQERQEAVDRANRLYDTANGALSDATAQVDSASAQVSQLMTQITLSLEALQSAVRESRQVLEDTAADLSAREE